MAPDGFMDGVAYLARLKTFCAGRTSTGNNRAITDGPDQKSTMTCTRIPKDTRDRLNRFCRRKNIGVSDAVRLLVIGLLEGEEEEAAPSASRDLSPTASPMVIRHHAATVLAEAVAHLKVKPSRMAVRALTDAGEAFLATRDLRRLCDRKLATTLIGLAWLTLDNAANEAS